MLWDALSSLYVPTQQDWVCFSFARRCRVDCSLWWRRGYDGCVLGTALMWGFWRLKQDPGGVLNVLTAFLYCKQECAVEQGVPNECFSGTLSFYLLFFHHWALYSAYIYINVDSGSSSNSEVTDKKSIINFKFCLTVSYEPCSVLFREGRNGMLLLPPVSAFTACVPQCRNCCCRWWQWWGPVQQCLCPWASL